MISQILRAEPTGVPRNLIVLTHGYGADAADLFSLKDYWHSQMPDTVFIAPNAPNRCEMNPVGFQWWSLADGLDPAHNLTRCRHVAPIFSAMLMAEAERYALPLNRIALVGFSQGAMLSLEAGLHLSQAPACIVSYSGMMLDENPVNITARPPVLLVHGMQDPIVPFVAYELATTTLKMAGVAVEGLVRPMMGHSIDDAALQSGLAFLRHHLYDNHQDAA